MKKGQIFSMDLLFAIVSFIVILLMIAAVWDYSRERVVNTEARNDLELLSHRALAVLLETPGNPSNWSNYVVGDFNSSNVLSLGLAKSCSVNNMNTKNNGKSCGLTTDYGWHLDSNKIQYLDAQDSTLYDTYKQLLGILGSSYEFSLQFKLWNGSGYGATTIIGIEPGNASNIVNMQRFAILNDTWTLVNMRVWTSE